MVLRVDQKLEEKSDNKKVIKSKKKILWNRVGGLGRKTIVTDKDVKK